MNEEMKKIQEQMNYLNEQYSKILQDKDNEIEWHKRVIERILHM